MIAVISPAKTLDFDQPLLEQSTKVRFPKETKELVSVLQQQSSQDLQQLMSVSENIADLNVARYKGFKSTFTEKNSRNGIMAFRGDVYLGLNAPTLSEEDMTYAQSHLRILSGLYGLLRPLDLIQPYRLEMGTKLKFDGHNNLYGFWEDKIVKLLHKDLKAQGDQTIVNLASNEYFKAVKRKSLKARLVDVEFKDAKNGEYKIISFFAKKARGLMTRYIIDNRINDVEGLKGFDSDGYYFDSINSTEDNLLFKRDSA
ncbi:MAG: peroxide stress protein YaaA [Reichenbachiella sp.]